MGRWRSIQQLPQTAAACAKLGWPIHLILSRANHGDDVQGNLLLDHILGATVDVVDEPVGPRLFEMITEHADRLRSKGRKVFAWDSDICKPRATVSYALCLAEVADQNAGLGAGAGRALHLLRSSTGAGAVLGQAVLVFPGTCGGRSIQWPWDVAADLARTAMQGAQLMGIEIELSATDVDVTHDYIAQATAFRPKRAWRRRDCWPARRASCWTRSTPPRPWPA